MSSDVKKGGSFIKRGKGNLLRNRICSFSFQDMEKTLNKTRTSHDPLCRPVPTPHYESV